MPRGRPRKPAALHVINGTARPDRMPRSVAQHGDTLPEPPAHLDAEARAEWDRLALQLHSMRLLTPIDAAVFAAYCQCYSRWREA